MFAFFKDELEERKSLKSFFYSQKQKLSKGFLKFFKLISNQILGQIIVSNLTTDVHKLNTGINYARLH